MGGLLGGPKGMLAPLSNYWGGGGSHQSYLAQKTRNFTEDGHAENSLPPIKRLGSRVYNK